MDKMRVYRIKIIIVICLKTNDIKIKLKNIFFSSPRHSFHSRVGAENNNEIAYNGLSMSGIAEECMLCTIE